MPPGRFSASKRLRLYYVAFAVTLSLGLVVGALIPMKTGEGTLLDEKILERVVKERSDYPLVTSYARVVTQLGNFPVASTLLVVIVAGLALVRRFHPSRIDAQEAPFWLIVGGGGQLMNWLLKMRFQRPRPPVSGHLVAADFYSFPSGHATFAGVSSMLLAIVIVRTTRERSRALITLGMAITAVLALSITISRVWLGVHYLSDVVVGFGLGMLWSGLCHGIRFGWPRRRRDLTIGVVRE